MLQDLSLRKKLYFGLGAIVILLLLLLLSTYSNYRKLSDANQWDRHTLQVLLRSNAVEKTLLDLQAEYRGFLLTGEDRFLGRVNGNRRELDNHLQELGRLVADNPVQRARVQSIEKLGQSWLNDVVAPLIDKRRSLGRTATAPDQIARDPLLAQGFRHIDDIHGLVEQINTEENRLLAERSASATELNRSMLTLIVGGGVACVLAALAIAVLLARSVVPPLQNLTGAVNRLAAGDQDARAEVFGKDEIGQVAVQFNQMAQVIMDIQTREREATALLREKVDSLLEVVSKAAAGDLTGRVTVSGSDAIGQLGSGLARMFDNLRVLLDRVQKAGIQVATSTTEIAASARQQESTGVEQAQTSVEVLSTTKEISANTAQLLKAMEEVTQVTERTSAATLAAHGGLGRMDQAMQRMVRATDAINGKLAALSEKASNINNVLTTITKVADQTNILSLNAAIEAEKAGEAGRGFSVVATEIRRLADQTSIATWDIEQMLKEMQSAVSASVMGMDKFSEEIRRSVEENREVGDSLKSVIDQVQKLPPRFDMVLEGMHSQAVGASQISETMTQLNEATQQAVDALRATSEAVQQLQYAAQDLQAGVSSFAVHM
ncbi:MAG TPA: methyl-accepting chemotaxis protein [Noviherbaspirillum sp.]|jgi:methyl-accepting chemotaxis protein WspA|uniref:methyl-accepting chemotaxis protein n=1 Tax=Noviherbaspirillum sp. TaxID=1926288 RepID=UPI002F9571CC